MQVLIVLCALVIALFYISRIIHRALKKDLDRGCSCSSCDLTSSWVDHRNSKHPIKKGKFEPDG